MKPYTFHPLLRTRFQPAYQAWPVNRNTDFKSTQPSANIVRIENGFEIRLAVPGIPKEQIKIEMNENQLVISATNPNQGEQPNFTRQEFDYSGFSRTFRLHKNADTENLKASFDQGILTIVVPDKEQVVKKIEIV